MIFFHGGGWIGGTKEASAMSVVPWLEMGWNVVNVEYRMSHVALAPAAVEDCLAALRREINSMTRFLDSDSRHSPQGFMSRRAGTAAGSLLTAASGAAKQSRNFDPVSFTVVPPRRFEDLRVGDVFRAPSRTVTDAHAAAFQTVSADNHPIHYDVEYARRHGHTAPVVHGLQVFAFTAPGATLFP